MENVYELISWFSKLDLNELSVEELEQWQAAANLIDRRIGEYLKEVS